MGSILAKYEDKEEAIKDNKSFELTLKNNKLPSLEVKPKEGYELSSFIVSSLTMKDVNLSYTIKDNVFPSYSYKEIKILIKEVSWTKNLNFNFAFKKTEEKKEEPKQEYRISFIGEHISSLGIKRGTNSNFSLVKENDLSYYFMAKEGINYEGKIKAVLAATTTNYLGWFKEDKVTRVDLPTEEGDLTLVINNTFSSNMMFYCLGEK